MGRALVRRDLYDGLAEKLKWGDEWILREYKLIDRSEAGLRFPHILGTFCEWSIRKVLEHDERELQRIEATLEVKLDGDQKRGLTELSQYYSACLHKRFNVAKEDKAFRDALSQSLATSNTDRALVATVNTLRLLVRPLVRSSSESEEGLVASEAEVERQILQSLRGDPLLDDLRSDHESMVRDPAKHRKIIELKRKQSQ